MAIHPQSIALASAPQRPHRDIKSTTAAIIGGANNSSKQSNSINSINSNNNTKLAKPKRAVVGGLRRSRSSDSIVSSVPLPADAQQLKDKILETHPEKLTRFSLSHMRRVAIPPVEIPKSLKSRSAVSTVVSGKNVPFTKNMWDNRKKRAHHLDMIDEYVLYK